MHQRAEIQAELSRRAKNELIARGELEASTVIGIVSPEKGLTHAIKKEQGKWVETKEAPELYLAEKLERVVKSTKRFIVIIGGRGSSKSVGVADICLVDAKDNKAKTYFLREYQSSIKQSVYNLLKSECDRLELNDFTVNSNSISVNDEEVFSFSGIARNTDSIKSAHGFKRFSVEESQFITQESLDALTPTVRNKPNVGLPKKFKHVSEEEEAITNDPSVSVVLIANPGSSEDPFSKRFINPFMDEIIKNGFYEDDLHLVVMMNYCDNPWFDESGLEEERQWDYQYRSRALYDHIWMGAMNDSVDNALIMSEWFDACIDAHLKLGFEAKGVKVASHDPSDTGPDSKGFALRHGMVFKDVQEMETGTVNDGGHWAANLAIESGADYYTWDGDGMGTALAEQNSADFEGKHTQLVVFKGSEAPDNPEALYQPAMKAPIENQKTNKETFSNKRAQYYFELRDRCYRTYRAVVLGEYHDPETLISFSSEIKLISKLRSELCRMPIKDQTSGVFSLYTKKEMKSKFKINSPNLGDPVMMSMRYKPKATVEKIKFKGW